MRHSTGTPNKYERERIEAMLKLGCVPCAQLGFWVVPEVQHILQGNKRMGHLFTLPVCPGHHRGVWSPEQVEVIPPDMRIAISDGSKAFERLYGTQRDMWMKVQVRLKLPAIWPLSKIIPRRSYVEANPELVDRSANNAYAEALLGRSVASAIAESGREPTVAAGDAADASVVSGAGEAP